MQFTTMAMAMLASPSLSSVCSNSGRTPAVSGRQQQQLPGAFSPKTNGDQLARRGVSVRAQQKRGSSGMSRRRDWVAGDLDMWDF